jgi:hypothetical protein
MAEGQEKLPAPTLSPSSAHAIALAARMLTLEEDCRQIERFLDGYAGVYYAYVGAFTSETRQAVRTLIDEILRRIGRIRLDLGLPQRQVEVSRAVAAHLSRVWVTLQESKADSLKGYGAVPPELGAYLELHVEEILALVAKLQSAIESGKKPPATGLTEEKSD